jgi:hypothetical protein
MGWIGPLMKEAGFVVDHEHNHCGQCWWEIRHRENIEEPAGPGELSGDQDVRLRAGWKNTAALDVYQRATDPDDKSNQSHRS